MIVRFTFSFQRKQCIGAVCVADGDTLDDKLNPISYADGRFLL